MVFWRVLDPAYARTERGCGQVGLGLADCGGGAVVQRSRIHSVDMSALTHCCCEYDGAVALTWTDFEDTRARKDVP